ncbi:hypothetical protein [Methylocaldum sp. GT1TLB]|uniref:hypothetical protein n=1 Tax=Methylocaldum sp. GT1TLB TaxID=3438965 RepID=UPI003DA10846
MENRDALLTDQKRNAQSPKTFTRRESIDVEEIPLRHPKSRPRSVTGPKPLTGDTVHGVCIALDEEIVRKRCPAEHMMKNSQEKKA